MKGLKRVFAGLLGGQTPARSRPQDDGRQDFIPPQGFRQKPVVQSSVMTREAGSLLTLFALILILAFLVLFYTRMRIEVSLLDRKIRAARIEKIEQERKNSALRAELARKKGEDAVLTYWKLYGALPDYEKNRVLRIRLPDK